MYECEPAVQRDFLERLVEGRAAPHPPVPGIAVWPPEAFRGPSPPADLYFYRPGELLVPTKQLADFTAAAAALGPPLDYTPASDSYVRPGESSSDGNTYDAEGSYSDEASDRGESSYRTVAVPPSKFPKSVSRFQISNYTVPEALRLLREESPDLRVTPNHVLFGCPNWALEPIGDPSAPPADQPPPQPGGGGKDIVVAIVDSGIPADRVGSALLDMPLVQIFPGDSEPLNPTAITFPQGHGSFVAGVVRQFAKDALVWSYRALDASSTTDEWALSNQLHDLMSFAGPAPRVINLSLGAYTFDNRDLLALRDLSNWAKNRTAGAPTAPIVVAAAGNNDSSRPFFPAASDWTISVGAAERVENDWWQKACFSDYNSDCGHWVDVCANGVGVASAFPAGEYDPSFPPSVPVPMLNWWAIWNGTSFAAPQVSGVVASILAVDGPLGRDEVLVALRARAYITVPSLGPLVQ